MHNSWPQYKIHPRLQCTVKYFIYHPVVKAEFLFNQFKYLHALATIIIHIGEYRGKYVAIAMAFCFISVYYKLTLTVGKIIHTDPDGADKPGMLCRIILFLVECYISKVRNLFCTIRKEDGGQKLLSRQLPKYIKENVPEKSMMVLSCLLYSAKVSVRIS